MDFAIPVENAARGSWCFKETEDDGVVVKVDGSRARNKANHLTENVVDVKPAKENGRECAGKVEVKFVCKSPNTMSFITRGIQTRAGQLPPYRILVEIN